MNLLYVENKSVCVKNETSGIIVTVLDLFNFYFKTILVDDTTEALVLSDGFNQEVVITYEETKDEEGNLFTSIDSLKDYLRGLTKVTPNLGGSVKLDNIELSSTGGSFKVKNTNTGEESFIVKRRVEGVDTRLYYTEQTTTLQVEDSTNAYQGLTTHTKEGVLNSQGRYALSIDIEVENNTFIHEYRSILNTGIENLNIKIFNVTQNPSEAGNFRVLSGSSITPNTWFISKKPYWALNNPSVIETGAGQTIPSGLAALDFQEGFSLNAGEHYRFVISGDNNFDFQGVDGAPNPFGGTQFVPYIERSYTGEQEKELVKQDDLNFTTNQYDLVVDADYSGLEETGSPFQPYKDLATAIANSNPHDYILCKGDLRKPNSTEPLYELPHSLYIIGTEGCKLGYQSYSSSNSHVFKFQGTDNTQMFRFDNLEVSNAGGYAVFVNRALKVVLDDCVFYNNGWDGTRLSTLSQQTDTWSNGGTLGYDSSQNDLQSFWNSSHSSNGGAVRIQNTNAVVSIDNDAYGNLRGLRFEDCGKGGYGFVSRNNCYNNIDSGLYLASSSYDAAEGCENFVAYNNASKGNANNGFLIVGGYNNVIALNQIEKNWNAGVMPWHVSNTVIRDNYLLDNNSSAYNGIGNNGDALGSLYLAGGTIKPVADFLAHIINNQIVASGTGSSTTRNGVYLHDSLDGIDDRQKSVILLDNNTMQGQDYAVVEECDLDKIRLIKGDNTYINSSIKDILTSGNGCYYELPFSNQHTNINSADFSLDDSQTQIIVRETSTDDVINIYGINTLKALPFDSKIRIIIRNSRKIQFDDLDLNNCTINGAIFTGDLAGALQDLNELFLGTAGIQETPVITSSTTLTMVQGDSLLYELLADHALSYEWSNLPEGISTFTGNMRKLVGGSELLSANSPYTFTAKAINAGGFDTKTITLNITQPVFATTKSFQFDSQDYAGANASLLDGILGRTGNNSGNAWSIAFSVKPSAVGSGRVLFYYGAQDTANAGHMEIRLTSTNKIKFKYGTNYNFIQLTTQDAFTAGVWSPNILLTYDGGTTGASSNSLNSYYDRFNIVVGGSIASTVGAHGNNGFTGAISGQNLRLGKLVSGNTLNGDRLAHVAIWDTDQTANKAVIHNGGTAFDFMTLTDKPEHRWRLGNGDTHPVLQDTGETGGAHFTAYGTTGLNIVTDSP